MEDKRISFLVQWHNKEKVKLGFNADLKPVLVSEPLPNFVNPEQLKSKLEQYVEEQAKKHSFTNDVFFHAPNYLASFILGEGSIKAYEKAFHAKVKETEIQGEIFYGDAHPVRIPEEFKDEVWRIGINRKVRTYK